MSILTKKLEARAALVREAFEGYDRCAERSNWFGAGTFAADARDTALVGGILCREFAVSLDNAGYGSAKEFYAWADSFDSDYRTACALVADVETFING